MTLVKKIKDKKVNFEFNKEYIKVVTEKISSNDAGFISNSFKEMHPADTADIIEHLNQNDRENLIKLNNFKIDPEVFVELNESIQTEIIKYLSTDSIVYVLQNLESDDAIKIIENLDEHNKNEILRSLPPKDRFALLESLKTFADLRNLSIPPLKSTVLRAALDTFNAIFFFRISLLNFIFFMPGLNFLFVLLLA